MKKVFAILLALSAFAMVMQGCAPAAEGGDAAGKDGAAATAGDAEKK